MPEDIFSLALGATEYVMQSDAQQNKKAPKGRYGLFGAFILAAVVFYPQQTLKTVFNVVRIPADAMVCTARHLPNPIRIIQCVGSRFGQH